MVVNFVALSHTGVVLFTMLLFILRFGRRHGMSTILAQDHFYSIHRHLQHTIAKPRIHEDVGSAAGMDVAFSSIGVRCNDS